MVAAQQLAGDGEPQARQTAKDYMSLSKMTEKNEAIRLLKTKDRRPVRDQNEAIRLLINKVLIEK